MAVYNLLEGDIVAARGSHRMWAAHVPIGCMTRTKPIDTSSENLRGCTDTFSAWRPCNLPQQRTNSMSAQQMR
jgi:hypothetical protein